MLNKVAVKRVLAVILAGLIGISNSAFAGCDKPVTLLIQGQKAPCRGYLFSPNKELEVRTRFEHLKLLEETIDIKERKVKLYLDQSMLFSEIAERERKKSELWRIRAEDSTEKLIASEDGRGKRDFLFIGAGVILTVLAGWAVGQASK